MRRTVVPSAPATPRRRPARTAALLATAAALAVGPAACASGITEPTATVLRPPLLDPNPGIARAAAPATRDPAVAAARAPADR